MNFIASGSVLCFLVFAFDILPSFCFLPTESIKQRRAKMFGKIRISMRKQWSIRDIRLKV